MFLVFWFISVFWVAWVDSGYMSLRQSRCWWTFLRAFKSGHYFHEVGVSGSSMFCVCVAWVIQEFLDVLGDDFMKMLRIQRF